MHKFSRRAFLASAGVFAFARGAISETSASDLVFLAVGDWGHSSRDQRDVAQQMAKTAALSGAQFIVSTGDNFYPNGVKSLSDEVWKTGFEEVYHAPGLQVPWHIVLGNHDHMGNVAAQFDYSKQSARWRLPANFYRRREFLADGAVVDFFHIDTDPIQRGWNRRVTDAAQLRWLERELATSTAMWKIVIGHHPVFSGGRHKNTEALLVHVKPLLNRYGVQVYLNGHNHNLEHVVVEGTHYLTSGAGSRPKGAKIIEGTRFLVADRLGFMTARLAPAAMEIEFIDEQGISLYRAIIPVNTASARAVAP